MRTSRSAKLFCLCCLAAVSLGCSAVPIGRQDRTGQSYEGSPLNQVTQTDDMGTITSSVGTNTDWVRQDSAGTLAHSTGMVTRTLTVERPDGLRMTLRSGSDAEGKIVADAKTGNVTGFDFKTSSSVPLTALGEAQAKYQETLRALSADQRAKWQAAMDAAKVAAPELFSLVAKAFGIP